MEQEYNISPMEAYIEILESEIDLIRAGVPIYSQGLYCCNQIKLLKSPLLEQIQSQYLAMNQNTSLQDTNEIIFSVSLDFNLFRMTVDALEALIQYSDKVVDPDISNLTHLKSVMDILKVVMSSEKLRQDKILSLKKLLDMDDNVSIVYNKSINMSSSIEPSSRLFLEDITQLIQRDNLVFVFNDYSLDENTIRAKFYDKIAAKLSKYLSPRIEESTEQFMDENNLIDSSKLDNLFLNENMEWVNLDDTISKDTLETNNTISGAVIDSEATLVTDIQEKEIFKFILLTFDVSFFLIESLLKTVNPILSGKSLLMFQRFKETLSLDEIPNYQLIEIIKKKKSYYKNLLQEYNINTSVLFNDSKFNSVPKNTDVYNGQLSRFEKYVDHIISDNRRSYKPAKKLKILVHSDRKSIKYKE
jgi:hypothetical protein